MNSSMLKRSEVDLRVAQELKNNRDFIYQTNQALQALREGIVSLSVQHERVMAKSGSDRKDLHIEFENLREEILKSVKNITQRMSEAEKTLQDFMQSFKQIKDRLFSESLTTQEAVNAIVPEAKKIALIEKNLEAKSQYFNIAIQNLKSHMKFEMESLKKDLTPIEPKVDPIKKQLDERFAVLKVDFDGLIQEINLLKRAVSYDQKKFENVYTLIERLKERIS